MEIICTRQSCPKPLNIFSDLDTEAKIRTVPQRFCATCGMPLLLADRYLPKKLLGEGGFGSAFLACDRYKPKLPNCVVKQFKPSSDLDAGEVQKAQELFQREANVLEELGKEHPQIPILYAFFTPIVSNPRNTGSEQYFYLAQEFIDGQDLEQELEAKGKFEEAEVTEVLREMLHILKFVHDRNYFHRDLKPSNIMRDRQGKLYLLDFGAVKQIAAGGSNSKKSTGIYSMGFAPPEQMLGEEIYPSTDLYALAVTCVNLLTGKAAETLYNSFDNVLEWQQFAPNISDRLKEIIEKMLLSAPSRRFQSATEVLDALETSKANQISPTSLQSISPSPQQQTLITNPKVVTPTRKKRSFSLLESISRAGFIGFEGALLSVGIINWLSFSSESIGLIGAIMGGIVFALSRRTIETKGMIIFAFVTAGLVTFIPKFYGALNATKVIIIATVAAAVAIAILCFFRLVYQLLSRWL